MPETDPLINSRIATFKADLAKPIEYIVRRHLTFGDCYALDQEKYFQIKSEVAKQFSIHPSEVVLVGSAKLGFSIAPKKLYRGFCDESDIDLAIVSPRLFDQVWELTLQYWKANAFWTTEADFKKYLFRGWIRPDKLPPSSKFKFCQDWWEFFEEKSNTGTYGSAKIKAGLYKSWFHIEMYQSDCIGRCKTEMPPVGRGNT